jgi:hypothetical protein
VILHSKASLKEKIRKKKETAFNKETGDKESETLE